MATGDAPDETPYERHVRWCREAGVPLANAPFIRCDCDYFEAGDPPGVCKCGHDTDDHEDGSDACMEQAEGDADHD